MKFRLHQVNEHITRGTSKGVDEIAEIRKDWAYVSIPDQVSRTTEGNVSYRPQVVTLHAETRAYPEHNTEYLDRVTISWRDGESQTITRLNREEIEVVQDVLEIFRGIATTSP